jgi:hypothetical protein
LSIYGLSDTELMLLVLYLKRPVIVIVGQSLVVTNQNTPYIWDGGSTLLSAENRCHCRLEELVFITFHFVFFACLHLLNVESYELPLCIAPNRVSSRTLVCFPGKLIRSNNILRCWYFPCLVWPNFDASIWTKEFMFIDIYLLLQAYVIFRPMIFLQTMFM